MRFVVLTLGSSLVFLLSYSLFISQHPLKKLSSSSWSHANRMRAEEYLFSKEAASVPLTVLGASLPSGLFQNYPLDKVRNLSCTGYNAITGLEVLKRRAEKPKIVLIEINVIEKGIAFELDSRNPYKLGIPVVKENIPGMRTANMPIFRTEVYLNDALGLTHEAANIKTTAAEQAQKVQERMEFFDTYKFDTVRFRQHLKRLEAGSLELRKQGTFVVWFCMPFECAVHPKVRHHNEIVAAKARELGIPFLWSDSAPRSETTDGLHLKKEYLEGYENWLLHQLDSLGAPVHLVRTVQPRGSSVSS
jgi:hypothetical protein